ncbi:protoporphyrinogen IX dehydrogenase [Clostridium homopropionicum DSM 5847]|uniref:Protoporphyrinogen IX dehydrogenase n=1 Tax=Clostridium homopropionicum DSM 5847 TaxID=1121318 RepID=A0A0L6ZBS9_9CLOT|nr:flavodoxin domain-containing protein [Clostridium homopropionicum]KOA20430.1 protoporphyrinogen IX dehydrogenase [Clostridium homopropionicum DSM 5847]SFG34658.1 menaquinone-dependent protoporphyrinogen oxidase [Clostridium homopropionicum]
MRNLILYATKHGCTKKCAAILSQKLDGEVDLFDLKEIKGVNYDQYDKVIIGGSIYAGRIQKEVSRFCIENIDKLKEKKLGLFICCMNESIKETQINTSFPEELLNSAVVKDSFGGEFNFDHMNFMEKTIVKMISKSDPNLPKVDGKENISKLSEDSINKFAEKINKA